MRDYASILKDFELHATGGTSHSILATGLYEEPCSAPGAGVVSHRFGMNAGVVEIAAMAARKEFEAVICLLDPKDPYSDLSETHALLRVCKQLNIRLATTLAGAEGWAQYEAQRVVADWEYRKRDGDLDQLLALLEELKRGRRNVGDLGESIELRPNEQRLALISHDRKKEEMVKFVGEYMDILSGFERILTTGTTGQLLQMTFAEEPFYTEISQRLSEKLPPARYQAIAKIVEKHRGSQKTNMPLVNKITPLRAKRRRYFDCRGCALQPLPRCDFL